MGARPGEGEQRGRRQVLAPFLLFIIVCEQVTGRIQYSIPEEMRRGSVVGNLGKDLGLNPRDLSERKVRVVSAAGNQYFTLNADAGTLHVNERIDREELCAESDSCYIKLQTVVENPLKIFHVDVHIQDINDNTPSFLKNAVDLNISESTLPGTRIAVGNARDPDIGINALQGYKLSSNQHFVLEETESNDGYKYAELVLEKGLDREKQSCHQLVLTAFDRGDPIRSSTVDININVLDANDNVPLFGQQSYRASISEGAAINTVVLQVKATDDDEGSNSKITYSFSSISDNALNTFSLDGETGEIKIKGLLDFEKTSSYKISVEAKDGGGHVAHCRVLIEIVDENDNAPEITFTSITNPVPENSPLDTVVALINVHDQDSGDNGEVGFHIAQHLPFKLISSAEKYYSLVTATTLDREAVPEYNITVTATDKGSPPLSTSRTIRLQFSDINDNPPVFNQPSYQVYVPENIEPGASIYRVNASDPDAGQNGHVTYSLNSLKDTPLPSYISINSQTGVIYAQRSYDFEQVREFLFQVKAVDSGLPPLSSNVTVKVYIIDQNDNPPEILYPTLESDGSILFEMVPPSSSQDYLVTKVVAVDADSGHNAWLSYHLLHVPESPLFKIGAHNGEIRTTRSLYEKDLAKQKIVICVKDGGQPSLSATVAVNIVFAENMEEALPELSNQANNEDSDSNLKIYLVVALALISLLFTLTLMVAVVIRCRTPKEPRIFESLSPPLYSHVDPRFSSNYQNGTLPLPYSYEVAVALESGQNELIFPKPGLLSTNDSGIVQESDGWNTDNKSLEQTLAFVYGFIIEYWQDVVPSSWGLDAIRSWIFLNNTEENHSSAMGALRGEAEPGGRRQVVFLLCFWFCEAVTGQIQYSIAEEMKRGSVVGNIGKDLGLNRRDVSERKLRVVSASGIQYFTLNTETGNLLVKDRFDREELCGESLSCSIKFQTIAENPLNIFHVEVQIQDINDNTPSFLKNSLDLELIETTLPGARISLGNARDPDIGINALQGYKLSDNPHFALEEKVNSDGSKHAELVLENGLDRETQSIHHLVLTASDGGEPIRSSTVDINIKVLDANDNVPLFGQQSYRASISEGAAINSVVLQVKATDQDEGSNSKITYSFSTISDNALNTFSLDADTGEIKVKGVLDFEKTISYKLTVEAKDGGGHVAHCRVLIEIIDENDNDPEITFTSIINPVPENSPPDTVVALIYVDDPDSGGNGEVRCHIAQHLPFKLLSSSQKYYNLVTATALDREAVPEYNITVTATDHGSPPLSTSRTIRLQLSDINDHPPVFIQPSYHVYVSENNAPGASIYRVNASDLDSGQNGHVTYSLSNLKEDTPLSSYISINSQTGVIYAQRSYDFEQVREFQFQVKAMDYGSPPLSSNVTMKVFVIDQIDNPPEILYPTMESDGSILFEMVPLSSSPDYLVTKVVAVDADSGHNAWLSYHLLHIPESPLFKIGAHNGEIRTTRSLFEKDVNKQKIVICVKDNGQPSLSAKVTLNIVFAENMDEALPELSNQANNPDNESNLKVYLVVALALISLLFTLTLMVAVVIRCRKHNEPKILQSLCPPLYSHIDPRFSSNYQNGTLPLPYSYEVAVALECGQNELIFPKPSLLSANNSGIVQEFPVGKTDSESLEQVDFISSVVVKKDAKVLVAAGFSYAFPVQDPNQLLCPSWTHRQNFCRLVVDLKLIFG
ncbi:uncharacterized protein LOC144767192 [Lissotriton helveticus]